MAAGLSGVLVQTDAQFAVIQSDKDEVFDQQEASLRKKMKRHQGQEKIIVPMLNKVGSL